MTHIEKMAQSLYESGASENFYRFRFQHPDKSALDAERELAQAAFDALIDAVPDLMWNYENGMGLVNTNHGWYSVIESDNFFAEYDPHYIGKPVTVTSWEGCDNAKAAMEDANAHNRAQARAIWGTQK